MSGLNITTKGGPIRVKYAMEGLQWKHLLTE